MMQEEWKLTSVCLVVLLAMASGFVPMACAAVKIIEKIDLKWCEGEGFQNMSDSHGQLRSVDVENQVCVKLFAGFAESAGVKEVRVAVEQFTVAEVRCALERKLPQLAPLLSRSAIAIDGRYAVENDLICTSSEIAVIPPVSGG